MHSTFSISSTIDRSILHQALSGPGGAPLLEVDGISGALGAEELLWEAAAALTQRDYVVLLTAERPDGTRQYLRGYSFKVTRKN